MEKVSPTSKFISDSFLIGTGETRESVLSRDGSLSKLLIRIGLAFDGFMGRFDKGSVFFRSSATSRDLISLRRASDYDARLFKYSVNNTATDFILIGNSQTTHAGSVISDNGSLINLSLSSVNRNSQSNSIFNENFFNSFSSLMDNSRYLSDTFTTLIEVDDIIDIQRYFYSGHVYDASSLSTLYIANGIVTSNCHCSTAPYSDRKEYEKWLNGLANGEHSLRFDEWKEQEVTRNLAIRNKNIYGIPTYHSETINKKTQKKVDQALHNVFKEYPEMREFIKKIEFSDKMEDSELASAVINRKLETTLRLNKNLFSDSKKLNDLLSNCPSVFTKKSSIEDYLTHECIHFLEWKYAIEKQQKKAFDYIEQDYYSRLLLKKACKECDLSYNDSVIEKEICLYARLKASEAIAEACSGGTSRLAKKIKYLVDKEWRGH